MHFIIISCDASLAGNSPTILPAFITYTLSHIPNISGSSDEITKIDFPESAKSFIILYISYLAPTSIPLVGSSNINISGSVNIHLLKTTFC